VSTIYLRYHYFADLLAGAALTVVGWTVAAWWKGRE
jgi:membrane-associated phospholipid phosphatase